MKKTLIDNYSRSIAENFMPETDRIEYKRELHTDVDIEKEVIAFLNYKEGGVIYIGIDKAGRWVGRQVGRWVGSWVGRKSKGK